MPLTGKLAAATLAHACRPTACPSRLRLSRKRVGAVVWVVWAGRLPARRRIGLAAGIARQQQAARRSEEHWRRPSGAGRAA